MKALKFQYIFLALIYVSAAGSIQSMTNSSDTLWNRTCSLLQPTAPPRAVKHDVSCVKFGEVPYAIYIV
jgi:hypothetical protein